MPAYRDALQKAKRTQKVATLQLTGIPGDINVLKKKLPGTQVDVYFVDYPPAFDRPGNPYVDSEGNGWWDNAERFNLFCRAVCEVAQDRAGLGWQPEIVHCNDWQSALVPALLELEPTRPATVFTIHNLAYQGLFPHTMFNALGLPTALWTHSALEFHNDLSFIKGGIAFADRITTVSARYASEIQTAEFGYGLEGLLTHRAKYLTGIVNGIDSDTWNPGADPHLTANYDADSLENKKRNKTFLQQEFKLPEDPSLLLLGFVGRLVEQKGIDLIAGLIPQLQNLPVQLVMLGSGDKTYEKDLQKLATDHEKTFRCQIGYDEALSHQIEGGCDAFLMPSRFEPCGLNQLYSLRYGTIPIVNNVGGLADTIDDLDEDSTNLDQATGFIMKETTTTALYSEIVRAIHLYQKPGDWLTLVKNGMQRDFSWQRSANAYVELYHTVLAELHPTGVTV
jgi:starch synthase